VSSFTRERFESSLAQLGIQPSQDVFARLQAAYSQPGRHYHSARHIGACLTQFDSHRALAQRPAEIKIALWFHDAVYDTKRSDNERHSADWAAKYLASERVAVDTIARVHALIMATRHDAPVSDRDQQLLVDVDLGVLGQPARVFDRYDADIRREYHWVPWPQYVEARRAVLNGFLNRPRIYSTTTFVERFEAQARHNIAHAIDKLEHDSTGSDRGNPHV
jgi:predicted metal-dependent HD superfamily phosphohydrolase